MDDVLKMLKEMRDEDASRVEFARPNIDAHSRQMLATAKPRLAALDQAVAIITEVDALLPVLQQMAHSVALGDAGDGALKRLIGLPYSKECPVCGSTEAGHVCDFV